jgi:hypothetical protein
MTDLYGRPLEPTPPRRLTLRDLRDLNRAGFPELAKALAAGACHECGHSRASSFHREACEERLNPVRAPEQPRQPWEPRAARRAA